MDCFFLNTKTNFLVGHSRGFGAEFSALSDGVKKTYMFPCGKFRNQEKTRICKYTLDMRFSIFKFP